MLNVLEFVIVLYLALATLDFRIVEIHAGVRSAGRRRPLRGVRLREDPRRGSQLILAAILVATVAAAVQVSRFSPSVWFTFLDVGHVLMCVCALVMMRGVERMAFYARTGV